MSEKTIQKDTVYEGKVINVERHDVIVENGNSGVREIVKHPGAVAILPIIGDKIYLVSQYRKAIEKKTIEIPAGKIESGEDPKACADRELKEELKMGPKSLEYMTTIYPSPGFLDEVIHIYIANGLYSCTADHDEDEVIHTVKLSLSEFKEKVIEGDIKDAKTIVSLLYYIQEHR
ncbi:NUDIX hydrolase [Natranaerobius trueperi]|uniref:ADP-ribose pyrophosphatase n=1 Tax=Natranaerobius trueperi TaxID=759412 RepID=A0A226BYA1_9FIRM|nr:NUDIX hydrolase [Natranaerobius trueperi]OWZ83993.1 ADP-ribose pyrophosphatase [Natranaerobius trueperi]